MTPTERAAFADWHAGAVGGGTITQDQIDSAEWGIAYERKRAAGVARACSDDDLPEEIAAEIEKGPDDANR